jgi:hypothetical protein
MLESGGVDCAAPSPMQRPLNQGSKHHDRNYISVAYPDIRTTFTHTVRNWKGFDSVEELRAWLTVKTRT